MSHSSPYSINTISEFHQFHGLPQPKHPLISVVDYAQMYRHARQEPTSLLFGYYTISVKRGVNKMLYGQKAYDFDEGVMYFMAPQQILKTSNRHHPKRSGWLLLIHPDFLWNTPLAKKIRKYDFFDYSVNEALFLSGEEENILSGIIQNIRHEYHTNIDRFSQEILISQIETLLNYSERFYQRQFFTRKVNNHEILDRLEDLLNDYFNKEMVTGLPSVQLISEQLNVSPNYLSSLLKVLTGQSTQQHIHAKLIEKAKEQLSTTAHSVSEIAYALGFEHSQSFSKLFKAKTDVSPLAFRKKFQNLDF